MRPPGPNLVNTLDPFDPETAMNLIRTTLAFAAFAAAGLAHAQEATLFPNDSTSMKSRAAVVAEVRQAMADGRYMAGTEGPDAWRPVVSTRAREQVRTEAAAALRKSAMEQSRERQIVGM